MYMHRKKYKYSYWYSEKCTKKRQHRSEYKFSLLFATIHAHSHGPVIFFKGYSTEFSCYRAIHDGCISKDISIFIKKKRM